MSVCVNEVRTSQYLHTELLTSLRFLPVALQSTTTTVNVIILIQSSFFRFIRFTDLNDTEKVVTYDYVIKITFFLFNFVLKFLWAAPLVGLLTICLMLCYLHVALKKLLNE